MKITLFDTFNKKLISTHNTLLGAVKKQRRHLASVQRANGKSSYLTYSFRFSDGTPVDDEALTEARLTLDIAR